MGVRGLTTYINFNQNSFLQNHLLHDTILVIDGNSLCSQLYGLLNCFSAFGGDYDKFADYTKKFFKHLRKCNITSYVIFDGSYEKRKLKTVHNRLQSKIQGASKLDPVTQSSLHIFPLLLRDVFKEILTEINISYTICEFEADDEIAAMARHLECPVLSYDSDFFIYNVLYIPFKTLDFKPKPIEVDGKRIYVLECKIYRVQYMMNNFGILKEEMLPLLATLLGNDFVKKRVFNKFFSQLKKSKNRQNRNEQQRSIHALFKWLQNETLESAISKIVGRMKNSRKGKVFAIIKKSMEGYSSKYCRSLKYFNITNSIDSPQMELNITEPVDDVTAEDNTYNDESSETSEDEEEELSSGDEGDEGTEGEEDTEGVVDETAILKVPEWFADGIRHKLIPQNYINLYTHHLHFCSPQAEDYSDKDSFLCAIPILRYAFDILTDYSFLKCVYVSRENRSCYRRLYIGREHAVPRLLTIPFSDMSVEQLNSYFTNFIDVKMSGLDLTIIELLPSNFQLFMISLLWWVANCQVPLTHVHSLLMSYVMLDVIDMKTGMFRGHYNLNNKYSKKLEELKKKSPASNIDDELFLNKNKVLYEDCLIAASVLLKHFDIDDSINKRPKSYDSKKIHSFAQFQCSLQQFNNLNILCRNLFETTKYSKCYNGTFVYNVALKLENKDNPIEFLEQYLRGANTVLMFYKSLCKVYDRCAEAMSITTYKCIGKKRRRRKKFKEDDEISSILRQLESEVII